MKLNLKKFMLIAFTLVAVFCPFKVSALESISAGEAVSSGRYSISEELPIGIDKKEFICTKKFEFPGELSKCDFKHLKVMRDITFVEKSTQKTVASVTFEINFRYNVNTRHAQCLSCYHDSKAFNDLYTVKTFSRPVNKNTELGSAIMRYELKDLKNNMIAESKEVDEDYLGKIDFKALENFNI